MDEYDNGLLNCVLWIAVIFLLTAIIVGCTPQHVIPNPDFGECHVAIAMLPNDHSDCVLQHL